MNPKPSSLDFYAFIENYRTKIEGCFIKKVYQTAETDFLFQLYGSGVGKSYLVISLKKGLFFYDADRPEQATPLSMLLRKSLSERRIVSIEQINFDRVVKLTLHTGQELILEMFRDGNFIITNSGNIEFATDLREWRNRKILKGEPYVPPSLRDPMSLEDSDFADILSESKASIVQTLATRLNLGGDMAEEVLYRGGLDKDLPAREATSLVPVIRKGIQDIMGEARECRSYYYKSENLLSPVRMGHIAESPDTEYSDQNEGILDYIQSHYPTEEEKDQISRRLDSMKKSIEEFKKQRDLSFARGNTIMGNLQHFDDMLRKLNKIRNGQELRKLNSFDGHQVLSYNPATKEIEVDVDGESLKLDITTTAGQNANLYFQKSKDFRSKIEGAMKAIEDTKAHRKVEEKAVKRKRKKEWFEIYHWFISSEGFLVISGRDAKSNERIVKRHLKEKDLYVHADVYGAPSTIIKIEGESAPTEKTIREACAFAISFSRAWPAGVPSGAAYWVYPSQVSKTPESGEFVSTGSWIVRGKRNYLFDLGLKLAIYPEEAKDGIRPTLMPVLEGSSVPDGAIIITPGDEKRASVSQKISKKLGIEREEIDSILPPGNSSIESGI